MARILIVDDEALVRRLLRDLLTAHGHVTEEAGDGQKGLEAYARNPPDLVIGDIMMPEMDGLEMVRRIRTGWPDARIISVAAVGEGLLDDAKAAGADRAFQKPFSMVEMLEAVSDLLG